MYDKLKWTHLRTKFKINRCLLVHKSLKSNVPEYIISNHFTRSDHKHSTRTSTSGSVNIPALRTVQDQRSFGYTGSKDFNSLPLSLSQLKSINILNLKPKSISATCCVMNIEHAPCNHCNEVVNIYYMHACTMQSM